MSLENSNRTARTESGILDRRALHVELSLGYRMLQNVGLVEASWRESDNPKYYQFVWLFEEYMGNRAMGPQAMERTTNRNPQEGQNRRKHQKHSVVQLMFNV